MACKKWIREVLEIEVDDKADLHTILKDGVILGELLKKLYPELAESKKFRKHFKPKPSNGWHHRQNIELFVISGALEGQVNTFRTEELYGKLGMKKVVATLENFAVKAEMEGKTTVSWCYDDIPTEEIDTKQIQEAKRIIAVGTSSDPIGKGKKKDGPVKNTSAEEQAKWKEAEEKKAKETEEANKALEEERKAQEEAAEAERKAEEERAAKAEAERQAREEEEKRAAEEAEAARKAAEEAEAERLAAEEAQNKEAQEEAERKAREAEEKQKELEAAENEKYAPYGGKDNYDKIKANCESLRKEAEDQEDGSNALHLAADKSMVDEVKYLVNEENLSPNAPNNHNHTALHLACSHDNAEIVQFLVSKGANAKAMDKDGETPLHLAANYTNTVSHVTTLSDAGCDINARNNALESALIIALRESRQEMADALIKLGADVNVHMRDGNYLLHIAALKGQTDLIVRLHAGGNLDLNPRDAQNATPLHLAVEEGWLEAAQKLAELGADIDTKRVDGWSPLYTAAYAGETDIMKFLIEKSADVNAKNEDGWVPLHAACAQGHKDAAELLVQSKAELNVLNDAGNTPLFQAVAAGRRTISDILVSNGADLNLSAEGGWKPIHASCFFEFQKLTRWLVNKGADVNIGCSAIRDYAPLHILISTDEPPPMELVELLLEVGKANPNLTNNTGGTALHLAAYWGHMDAVKTLTEKGADLNMKNDNERTSLDLAARYGHQDVAEFLAGKMGVPTPTIQKKDIKSTKMDAPK